MSRDEEDGQDAGTGHNSRPEFQGHAEIMVINKTSEQPWTSRAYDVLAGHSDAVRQRSVARGEPFTKGECRGTVDESTSKSCHDPLSGDQVPDMSAEGRQDEAHTRQRSAAKSCCLTLAGPSSTESREQERHGKVHDTVRGRSNDTCKLTVAFESPLAEKVFLEDAIAHGESCQRKDRCSQYARNGLPHIGSCSIADPTRTQDLFLLDSPSLVSSRSRFGPFSSVFWSTCCSTSEGREVMIINR